MVQVNGYIVDARRMPRDFQQAAFERLPESFSFKDARMIYGRQDPAVNLFLHKLIRLGWVDKTGRGQYHRREGVG